MAKAKPSSLSCRESAGFSLVELLVLLVIAGILAFQVFGVLTGGRSKVRGEIFTLRTAINFARSEAVKRHKEVRVDFLSDEPLFDDADGYRIWIDENSSNNFDAGEQIRETAFDRQVRFYDPATAPPGGPPPVGDGIAFPFGYNRFTLRSDGTADFNGSVYVYAPQAGMPGSTVFKLVLGHHGRIRLFSWSGDSAWSGK